MSKSAKHLYEQFKPEHYDLSLRLDKDKLSFTGSVVITGKKTGRPSKRITFHQRGLNVTSAKVTKQTKNGSEEILVSRIMLHKSYDEVRLHTSRDIHAGDYTVELEFSGKITDSMLGIYPSNFTYNGKKETIIATQFESHYAREVFPSIDEPEAKATFDLTLITKKGDVVLSNTPTKHQNSDSTTTTTQFETTPRMSTYLLAFVTGPMHFVEGKTKDGTTIRSWSSIARPKKELQYSVDEAVRVLDFFTEYFGVPYPLEKCDQVALPDFDAGAMENWGLITYREVALLSDPDNPSVSSEQYISLVVAHELSHQWFGNLVTMKWWDDLWLNESFASLMEHIALDVIHPNWHQWEFYAATDVIATSSRDIYKDVQPVGVKVTDPELIDTLFDPSIVYAKGGRLLKMLRDYIGDETFRQGLKHYFEKHAYGNTSREDLWQAMSQASNNDISQLMTPWIEQSGMPVITVKQSDKQIQLTQKRFILDSTDDPSLWPVPLLSNQRLSKDIFSKKEVTVQAESNSFVILNKSGSGHYFTLYESQEHKEFLAKAIAERTIPAESRINMLNDSILLARGGQISLVDSLSLIRKCATEDRDNVWALIARVIGSASQLTEDDEVTEENIKSLKRTLAKDWYKKLGWDNKPNDDPNTIQLRHTALGFMLGGEDELAIAEATKRFKAADDLHTLDAETRASILGTAVRHKVPGAIDQMVELYPQASPELQIDITSALSSTKDASSAKDILDKALGPKGFVRTQDIMRWVAMFLRNRYTRQVIWDYIVNNWDWLEDTLGKSKSFDYLPVYCASVMNSDKWEKKYHKLFTPHVSNKTLERNIKVGFSDIAARVAWRKRDEVAIAKFFTDL